MREGCDQNLNVNGQSLALCGRRMEGVFGVTTLLLRTKNIEGCTTHTKAV